jgi:hypothetical protein
MITIAGGIILAVLFFAVLPHLITAAGWALVIGSTAALLGTVSLLLWSWGQSDPTSLGIMCIAVGGILVLNRIFAKAGGSERRRVSAKVPAPVGEARPAKCPAAPAQSLTAR